MAGSSVQVRWKAPMLMVGAADGTTTVLMDTRPESGGTGVGPSPIDTVLVALAGCSGMDVVGILRKARAPLLGLTITATAERAAEHPKVFTHIHLRYTAWGAGLTSTQVHKAVNLSLEKYCSVSAMLRPAVPITHEIAVGDTAGDASTRPRAAQAG